MYGKTMPLPFLENLEGLAQEISQPMKPATPLRSLCSVDIVSCPVKLTWR
jgi:hypothetical protein